jgi:hypothetical protein
VQITVAAEVVSAEVAEVLFDAVNKDILPIPLEINVRTERRERIMKTMSRTL